MASVARVDAHPLHDRRRHRHTHHARHTLPRHARTCTCVARSGAAEWKGQQLAAAESEDDTKVEATIATKAGCVSPENSVRNSGNRAAGTALPLRLVLRRVRESASYDHWFLCVVVRQSLCVWVCVCVCRLPLSSFAPPLLLSPLVLSSSTFLGLFCSSPLLCSSLCLFPSSFPSLLLFSPLLSSSPPLLLSSSLALSRQLHLRMRQTCQAA